MIELKSFQQEMVERLLQFMTDVTGEKELYIKAPTGAGKTICLLSWINEYIKSTTKSIAFVWFTPGAGELEEQSLDKARFFDSILAQSVDDALLQGFGENSITFINYERVVGRNTKAMLLEGEKDSLNDKIRKARDKGIEFVVVIDEAHRNDTHKARGIISAFSAVKTVRVSATLDRPNTDSPASFYEVSESAVIDSGLITKAVVVNEDIDITVDSRDEITVLLNAAEKKRQEILDAYLAENISKINPLVIIQIPDSLSSEIDFVNRIEGLLQSLLNKNYENRKVGVWLSELKRNHLNVQELDNPVEYLIIKQAIATGWDAPRAKILVKLRENMGEVFTIQTIGRIRRMPLPTRGHFGINLLDNSYVYTFDTDFLSGAFSAGGAVARTPPLKAKEKTKVLKLESERSLLSADSIDEKLVLKNLSNGFTKYLGLTADLKSNYEKFKSQGYILGDELTSSYKQGQFDILENAQLLRDKDRTLKAHYREHRLDLLHAFHELHRVIHVPVGKIESILQHLFAEKGQNAYKLLSLEENEWTAFILNNWKILRGEARKIDSNPFSQGSFNFENITKSDFYIPISERYPYNPQVESEVVESSAYNDYSTGIIAARPSRVERMMERYLDENYDSIDFVYKNGDKGTQYFSIVYENNGGQNHFYPDFIIRMKSGEIYILETKGGIDQYGNSLNIDEYSESKYLSLKRYCNTHGYKWAFVRDKNDSLWYLNDDIWHESMTDGFWEPIDKLFL